MKKTFTGNTRLFLCISGAIIVIALVLQIAGVGLNLGLLRAMTYVARGEEKVPVSRVFSRLKYFLKGKKFAAIPLVLSSAVCILMPSMIRQTSVLLIVIGALTIAVSFIFYKKGALEE